MMRELMDLVQMSLHRLDLDIEELMIIGCVIRESTRPMVEDFYADKEYAYNGGVIPTDERVPTSLKSISVALNMSRETTRRKLIKIVEKGILIRVENGYVYPEQTARKDFVQEIMAQLTISAERMIDRVNKYKSMSKP